MKLREIARYEIASRLGSASTWIYAAVLFLVAIWMFLVDADSGEAFANAPSGLVWGFVRAGMFGMLVSAAIFGGAAIRDFRAGMDPLVFTAPLKKADYLGGRFLGALAVNALVLVAIPLGLLAATALLAHFDPDVIGPVGLRAYLEPYAVFLLPNLVLVGAVLFAVGMLSRQAVPVYLAAIAVFIGYIVALNYASAIDSPLLAALVDPLGLVTLDGVTEYWTVAERNARLVGLPVPLLWNRALWLGVAIAALALLHWRFRFRHPDEGGRGRRQKAAAPSPERARPVNVPRVAGAFGFGTTSRQTFAVARNSLAEIMASRWFVVVLLACMGLPLLWGWNVGSTVFDTSTWPVTLLIVGEVLSQRSVLLFLVLVFIFAGELVWKEREVGAAEIADAAPVSNAAALLGRFLALVALIVMFQAAGMIGGLLIQVLQGYYHFELGLYFQVVFGLKLVDYVLLGALAMTLHVFVNHKNIAHMIVLMAFGFTVLAGALFGIQHHLLLYNTAPRWIYSDMNGFGPFMEPFIAFKLYWAAWAALLLLLAILLRVRDREPRLVRRLRQARARFAGATVPAAVTAVALILAAGGFVFYNTNILNTYRSADEQGALQADYEKRYARYEGLPQPMITGVKLHAELYPHERAVELRGSYTLVNETGAAIESVHVYLDPAIDARSLSFDRATRIALKDEKIGYRIYALERALAPGDAVQLAFDLAFRVAGFPNDGIPTDLVANGTSINRALLPFIGYQPVFELSDEDERAHFGLAPQPPMPGAERAAAMKHRWAVPDSDLVHVDAIVGTSADQVAITPGALRESWTENGRRYFHYTTETPIAFGGTIVSARYEVLEDHWKDPAAGAGQVVALRVFHHPAHDSNLDRIVRGMKASLAYLTAEFGPYPYGELNIAEIPRYGGFGSAHPYTFTFTEDFFFSRVREGEVDQPFYGVAHEVAHTWWGGLVRGAPVRGAEFLSESLANYSAMMVTEKTYGAEAGRRVYGFQMERYLLGRAEQSHEVPLLEVEDQPYIAYRKGALAMYILRRHIGEAAVNGALRRYFEKYRDAGPPYPTALDLYAELRAVTPASLHPVLEDWFETITLWDVRADNAVVAPAGDGEYEVTLTVTARKLRADSLGKETEVPMDQLVEIGVFAAGETEPFYIERHRVRSGEQTIRITVPRKPARAGIDPWNMLIDRERQDNAVEVETNADARLAAR
ncbi:MAG TPA: M1 family aminopeptidase [Gammaproteobacteria bacterium]